MYTGRILKLAFFLTLVAPAMAGAEPLAVFVSTTGNDAEAGTREHPFRTLERAQQAVWAASDESDVIVSLAGGIYRLRAPLYFGTADGGRNGHAVTWTALPGERPIVSGALAVTGWKLYDRSRNIYVADVPQGIESRQLFVDGALAQRAQIEISRTAVRFTRSGLKIVDPALRYLAKLPQQKRIEVEGTGHFTDRFSPVQQISGTAITMQQPAWDNNIWGYDTIPAPFLPENGRLYLLNSLAFLKQQGQWFLDPEAGKLYYRLREGVDPNTLSVELPRLPFLLSIAGTYDPVRNLTFRGLQFSHTSWIAPLTSRGYASQQSGNYLFDMSSSYPKGPLKSCHWGCRNFETMRNEWSQMPAAVQVARAEHVTFDHNVFAHLGQIALGAGNDRNANASNIGLGAQHIVITSNLFTDIAGAAVLVGGVRREAHHPSDPRQVNADILIANNRIRSVSKEFRDHTALLSTYVDGAKIIHNDISDVPYDAIDTGFGWGMQDVGGNPSYRARQSGYDRTGNIEYQVPTTLRNTLVAYNRLHDVKKLFEDGGSFYNLSANPNSEVRENFLYDIHGHIGLYLDEGSRGVRVVKNVVDGTGQWLNDNTVRAANPMRITIDNKAIGNWHNSDQVGGQWIVEQNDLMIDNHRVDGQNWPAEARSVMAAAGIEPGEEPPTP